jgi:2-oxoglutarate dehydrogenase E2 component (dihydrolipoamide succinyltransferase)
MASFQVPPLGESIVEATVSRWLKQVGDQVAAGEMLVELETDKITVEVPALTAGVLSAQNKAEGDVVNVGDVLGDLTPGEGASASAPSAESSTASAATPASAATSSNAGGNGQPGGADAKASPAARRLADEQGTDLSTVPGTGRGGVVSKADVIEANKAPAAKTSEAPAAQSRTPAKAPSAPAMPSMQRSSGDDGPRETREKMSTRRRRIAENLLQSQQNTAHLTTFNEIDMTAVSALRDRMRERVEKQHGLRLSYMPFFAKAACLALEAYPTVNAQIDGDHFVYHHYVNLGIAVASDAGLVVPNVKNAHQRSMIEIGQDIGAIAKKARDGKLSMDDLTGGTFTITNGGVFGSLVSTPIINYPQVGILGLHKIQERPVAENGQVVIRPMMYVALSYDHRIIDGQQAVLFLVRVKELMEDPASMLLY